MNSQSSNAEPQFKSDIGRTRWSMVAAVRSSNEADAQKSLADLCRRYWVPIYAYVRRSGHGPDDSVHLVQAFLSQLVSGLRQSEPRLSAGFREYMQTRLEKFLTTDRQSIAAIETLPSMAPPWPIEEIERRISDAHIANAAPAEAMQRGFVHELVAIALAKLEREAARAGHAELFSAVRPFLSREPVSGEYAELAEQMRSSPLAMVIAVKRLRQRFQEIVDEELSEIVGNDGSLERERQTLLLLAAPKPPHG